MTNKNNTFELNILPRVVSCGHSLNDMTQIHLKLDSYTYRFKLNHVISDLHDQQIDPIIRRHLE